MGKIKDLYLEQQERREGLYEEEGRVEVHNNDELSDAQVYQKYYKWLTTPLLEEVEGKSYTFLLTRLHSIDFSWFVPNDDNRAYDGEKLRERFIDDLELGYYEFSLLLQKPCSVLEMILGVSVRITDLMDDEREAASWFWEIMNNLDLKAYTDDQYTQLGGIIFVKDIITNMLRRNYTYYGNGGLFPLRNSKKDQRKVEIWYQMQQYLQDYYLVDCS